MCVSTIADTTSWLEHQLLRAKASNNTISHAHYDMIDADLIERIVSQYLLTGNAFVYKIMLNNKILWLEVLRSDNVYIQLDAKGNLLYYEYNNWGTNLKIEIDEMINIAHFSPFNALWSFQKWVSPVQAIAMQMETDTTSIRYNWNFFKNGATVRDVLSTDKQVSPEAKARAIQKWNNQYRGVNNQHKTAFLDNGITYTSHAPSQKEMDFIESRRFTRDEVLAIFKIPKAIVWVTDDVNRSTAEVADNTYRKNCILPIVKKIEQAFNKHLFKGIWHFEFIDVVPDDRDQYYKDFVVGAISLNEYRSLMWYEAVEWGDDVYDISDSNNLWTRDEEENKSKYSNIVSKVIRKNTPNTPERLDALEEKGNQKRITKVKRMDWYEEQFKMAVKDVWQQQTAEILIETQKNRYKGYTQKKIENDIENVLGKIKWQVKRFTALRPVMENIFISEGTFAYQELWLTNQVFTMQPKTLQYIRQNIKRIAVDVDSTTKQHMLRIVELWEVQGLGTDDVVNQLASELQQDRSRLSTIVRTETTRASNQADYDVYKDSWLVTRKRRVSELDNRTSHICQTLHGTIIELDWYFAKKWQTVGNTKIEYENILMPPGHPNCRSVTVAIID